MVSPYDVLMIDEDADEDEIEQAYRERIKQTHPDQGGSQEEFRLVKSAYEEIQSDRSAETNSSGKANSRTTGVDTDTYCSNCGSPIHDISKASLRQESNRIFCEDCTVETYCRICGKDLLLSANQFSAVNGMPVCTSCNQQRQAKSNTQKTEQSNKDSSSNSRLQMGILAGILLVICSLAIWYYRPTVVVTLSPESVETLINIARFAGPGILIFLWIILRRR